FDEAGDGEGFGPDGELRGADRGQGWLAEEWHLRALGAQVLIDEERENSAASRRLDHLARRACGAAVDGVDAGAGAEVADVTVDVGFVALALQDADRQPFGGQADAVREALPVAAMRGEDDDAAAGAHLLERAVEAVVFDVIAEIFRVDVRHPEDLEHRLAEVMERRADRGAAAGGRPVGEGDGEVLERAPAVAAGDEPRQLAEGGAAGAGEGERQTAHDRAEPFQDRVDDATP